MEDRELHADRVRESWKMTRKKNRNLANTATQRSFIMIKMESRNWHIVEFKVRCE